MEPFLISDPARYRSAGPNALTSSEYAREFDEVKALGSSTSSTRTADQTDMARFWAEGPIIWTRITRDLAAAHELESAESARLLAMLYLTGADSAISCWDDKARWLYWRPVTAIREADRDGNPATEPDAGWLPLINNPPYPDHPSGLACLSSAMATTLANFLGDDVEFSATSSSSTTTRSWTSFSEAVDEIVDARVYSGVHFRIADEHGALIGKQVGEYGTKHYLDAEEDDEGED